MMDEHLGDAVDELVAEQVECLIHLGIEACTQGDYAAARSLVEECLAIQSELGNKQGIPPCLEGLACLAAQGREWERAAWLYGAATALRAAIGVPLEPKWREEWEGELGATRAALGEAAFAASWAEGRTMPLDAAIEEALDERCADPPPQ